jgi:hypothetical protein
LEILDLTIPYSSVELSSWNFLDSTRPNLPGWNHTVGTGGFIVNQQSLPAFRQGEMTFAFHTSQVCSKAGQRDSV